MAGVEIRQSGAKPRNVTCPYDTLTFTC